MKQKKNTFKKKSRKYSRAQKRNYRKTKKRNYRKTKKRNNRKTKNNQKRLQQTNYFQLGGLLVVDGEHESLDWHNEVLEIVKGHLRGYESIESVGKEAGQGVSGSAVNVISGGEIRIIKIINLRNKFTEERLEKEIRIQDELSRMFTFVPQIYSEVDTELRHQQLPPLDLVKEGIFEEILQANYTSTVFVMMEKIMGHELFKTFPVSVDPRADLPKITKEGSTWKHLPDIARNIFAQMVQCVGLMHAQNIVHRDIKPENFMIGPGSEAGSYRVYIIDFDSAEKVNGADGTLQQEEGQGKRVPAAMTGTIHYLSPEQIYEQATKKAEARKAAQKVTDYRQREGVQAVMLDNPSLTEEEAKAKAETNTEAVAATKEASDKAFSAVWGSYNTEEWGTLNLKKADICSLGLTLWTMTMGSYLVKNPIEIYKWMTDNPGKEDPGITSRVSEGGVQWVRQMPDLARPDADNRIRNIKLLVDWCCNIDPNKRPTIEEIKSHAYFTDPNDIFDWSGIPSGEALLRDGGAAGAGAG